MAQVQHSSAFLIESDEELSMKIAECQEDASVLETAQELLALRGKARPLAMTHFRPLHRARTFAPNESNVTFPLKEKKRDLLMTISDDEEDCHRAKRARGVDLMSTIEKNFGGYPSGTLPLGRPLACPPRLPCLAPGVALPPAMTVATKVSLK